MSRLLLLFLGITSVYSTFKKYPEIFIMTRNGTKTIIDPAEPIIAGDREFYWTGFHQPSLNLPLICDVQYSSESWHFGVVHFANGSEPRGVQFGCPHSSICGTFECLERPQSDLTMMLIIVVLLFLLGYELYLMLESRTESVRLIRELEKVTPIVPANLPLPKDIHNDNLRFM